MLSWFVRRDRSSDRGAGNTNLTGIGLAACASALFTVALGATAAEQGRLHLPDRLGLFGTGSVPVLAGDIHYDATDFTGSARSVATESCTPPGVGGPVTPLTCEGARSVLANFPRFQIYHCWRERSPDGKNDHNDGVACDFTTTVDQDRIFDQDNVDLGNELAVWLVDNHEQLGIRYVIWRQHIWESSVSCSDGGLPELGEECWTPIRDRGGPTQNHHDHVHVTWEYVG